MGSVVNLAAPGDKIGWGMTTGRTTGDGTSYAAPMVTGAAGLVHAINTTLTTPEIRNILIGSANNSLVPRTTRENRSSSSSSCMSFPSSETAWSASTPGIILNLKSAVETALLAKAIDLDKKEQISLQLGQKEAVQVDVEIPAAGVLALDVIFLIDQSGSYSDDIDNLQLKAGDIIDGLNGRGIDVQFGVAGFADFPISPYGDVSDTAYRLYQDLTANTDVVVAAIDRLDMPLMDGSDPPESQLEALYQVATGRGRDINGDGDLDDPGDVPSTLPGWREGALPIVIFATDAAFHDSAEEPNYPGATKAETIRALRDKGIIVVGLQSGDGTAAAQAIREITNATNGVSFSLDAASSEIIQRIADALDATLASIDVTLEVLSGDGWVELIEPAARTGAPGETVTFTVNLEGARRESIENLAYIVYLWARADERALLKRVAIPINVPSSR